MNHWNKLVQDMNPNNLWHLHSKDTFGEVDDPENFLANMMTADILNKFRNTEYHLILELKVGDIWIVLRNLSIRDDLQNNARVRITYITKFAIRLQTIEKRPKSSSLPRIFFKFKLPFMQSYTITRLQFPLRLAYYY
jgi:hypothetical protein